MINEVFLNRLVLSSRKTGTELALIRPLHTFVDDVAAKGAMIFVVDIFSPTNHSTGITVSIKS